MNSIRGAGFVEYIPVARGLSKKKKLDFFVCTYLIVNITKLLSINDNKRFAFIGENTHLN